jgi:radical SAM family uncharacterized protein
MDMMNEKLALSERVLMRIEKPARYIGGEVNMIRKNPEDVAIRFAICFPDVYEIGMSHLGIQILYDMFNQREDIFCERVYSPWPDLHQIMKEENIPLFALESQDPVKEFDFLGITLQYEMCYPNILQILDLSGIPLFAKDRGEEDPIVIGGGPCVYNPEPIADFFDLFYIGEGETVYDQLFDLYREKQATDMSREEFLYCAANIPGIYVPSLYDVTYHDDGTVASFAPNKTGVPEKIEKQVVVEMDAAPYPDKPLVPYLQTTQDRVVLEIQRGCIRGCRFCQAGMIYRPLREHGLEDLKQKAKRMLEATGQDEISLSSLSSSDYRYLKELLDYLVGFKEKGVNISLPSLRIDAFSLDVMSKVQDVKKSSLTFAPEAGSQRLRDVINKGLTKEDILNGSSLAFEGGWNKVKLYFMLGQPTETEADMEAIATLAEDIAECYYDIPKDQRNGKCQITVSTSFFVPKPFTPFQWAQMSTADGFREKASFVKSAIRSQLNQKSIRYNWHEPDVTMIEGVLARGDRKLSEAILNVYQAGGIFAAWTEYFSMKMWMQAFADAGIDPDFYTVRERSDDEVFPWDFIDAGVSKRFLLAEWKQALGETVTPNCRQQCAGCGARRYGGGVCYEDQD